jgi:uncharacterized protein (DUF433 family)
LQTIRIDKRIFFLKLISVWLAKVKFGVFEKMNKNLINRITIDPDICHGKPTIRSTRYTVDLILDLLSAGMSETEIIDDYPALEINDIKACLAFASQLSKVKTIHRIVA